MYSEMERIWRQRTNNQLLLYLGVEFIISIPVSFLVVLVHLIARHQCGKFGTHHIDDTTSWHNQEHFFNVSVYLLFLYSDSYFALREVAGGFFDRKYT